MTPITRICTDFQNINIQELIPQRPPMVMVDKLTASDEISTTTSFLVHDDNIFCRSGKIQEAGLVENIAQTAAARAGYIAMKSNKEIPVGFIGGIKNLHIHLLPEINTELITTIRIIAQVFGATVVAGEVKDKQDRLYAECEMKIFLEEESGVME
ncbi:MAG: hydroxymyristoyl-ACP dehydratase [Bacteroidales bacterium]|nr:hydroxymyristoyl-ACP dehydratase [Bacteroidales bacterium]MCF8458656.1 hydroxymyristoyl-ACP dehydratase [Bacteroidales bacterium]